MKSREKGARRAGGLDAHTRDGVTAVIGLVVVVVAAFGACKLDDKNPPLANEAPNRGQFVGGIAIGAGPGGTGGSGAGLGSGGSSSSGGGTPSTCACAESLNVAACQNCFQMSCSMELDMCTSDTSGCDATLVELQNGGCDSNCLALSTSLALSALLTCGCGHCAAECDTPANACP